MCLQALLLQMGREEDASTAASNLWLRNDNSDVSDSCTVQRVRHGQA